MNLEFTPENFEKLKAQNQILEDALKGVVNSCVHPDTAFRAVMVELSPIRKALKKNQELFGS